MWFPCTTAWPPTVSLRYPLVLCGAYSPRGLILFRLHPSAFLLLFRLPLIVMLRSDPSSAETTVPRPAVARPQEPWLAPRPVLWSHCPCLPPSSFRPPFIVMSRSDPSSASSAEPAGSWQSPSRPKGQQERSVLDNTYVDEHTELRGLLPLPPSVHCYVKVCPSRSPAPRRMWGTRGRSRHVDRPVVRDQPIAERPQTQQPLPPLPRLRASARPAGTTCSEAEV